MDNKYTIQSFRTKLLNFFFFIVVCLFISQSMAAVQEISKLDQLESKANRILYEIKKELGEAKCELDSHCKTLPIGHKPCGGPTDYLIFSLISSDEQRLLNLSKEHMLIHRQINKIKQLISTCEMLMPPPVACINNKCQLK